MWSVDKTAFWGVGWWVAGWGEYSFEEPALKLLLKFT